MHFLKLSLILTTFFLVLESCDPISVWDYNVHNNLTEGIEVIFVLYNMDTMVTVEAGQTKMIHQFDGLGFANEANFIKAIGNVRIQTDDTLISIDESKWFYNELKCQHAQFTLEIDSTLF